MKIAMIASEGAPFAKTGGLADVVGALPLALEYYGQEVIIIMPCYKCISGSRFKINKISEDVSFSVIGEDIKVYFIENNLYFNRDGLYGDKNGDYRDNLERFSFFCRRAIELLEEINFSADILHLHDWQSSLISVYLRNIYSNESFYKKMKCILTIHNLGYQGIFDKGEFAKLGLSWDLFSINGLEFYGKVNLLKGGIISSDFITAVSPSYAKEIQTEEFGFGLDGLLRERKNVLNGVLNGIDYSIWDPAADRFIMQNFSEETLENKVFNKEDLQKTCGLEVNRDLPLLGMVSRLAQQKGFDILTEILSKLCKMDLQLVILGTGDLKYQQILKIAAEKYPKIISLNLRFDDRLAHQIYAGSDIFLMPSRYEPCGLGQLISLRYGTIPLVFKTGGLKDTINTKIGFLFSDYSKEKLFKSIEKAVFTFKNKPKWMSMIRNAMKSNFSWSISADKYIKLYAKAKRS